ncbi:MAG: TIGR03032 family protein [Gammaproteobacteria bacterium]|nr:TIGR03032 family protein [Gammaproteobacteria bacterium]
MSAKHPDKKKTVSELLSSQHTTTFPQLLKQANASLVVSTYQAGKLILLRAQENSLNTHFVSLPKPMGVAFANGRLSVGSGHQVIDYFNMANVGPKVEPVNTHDAAFLPRQTHITGDIDIHEMGFDKDNELWIVNTKMSCLCTVDLNHSIVPRWRPPFISGYDLTDRCHLNGLAMRDGKPRYVSALGTTDTPGGWRDNKAFGGMIMDIESNRMIADGLSMPHSPRWYRDKLWVLESGAGQLVTIDEQSGEKTVVAQVPGFCRGIDFVERYAVIGLSEVRETAVFAGLPLTEREQDRKCGVWIVDIEKGETVGFLVFSGGVQEIFSVQLVPWKYPALLDLHDPLLRSSYSIPDEAIKDFTPPDPKQLKIEQAIQHHRRKELDQAIAAYQGILQDDPENVTILYHLGVAYSDKERWDEAIDALNKALQQQPNHAEAHNSLGHAHAGKLDFDTAIKCYDAAIAADQKYATAHFNRGCVLLKQGKLAEGWEEYEWRWKMPTFRPFNCPQPQWKGEDISDKTLLVHTEQGNGDAIQFARFLPQVRQRCKKLVLVCTEPLRLLFKEMDCVDEVRLPGNLPTDLFDVYCPIMSLAGVLNISLDNLYADAPYMKISPQVVVPQLAGNGKPKIGLVWAGSPTQQINHHRSCPIDEIMRLAENDAYDFYSFQLPISGEHKQTLSEHGVTDLEQELVSYSHTGALLQQMDLVISVCTSVVHLAGSLKVPALVLLSPHADWRWLSEQHASPWYPRISIMRQQTSGDWAGLIDQVNESLATRFS